MEVIKFNSRKTFNFEIDGKEYKVLEPTPTMQIDFEEKIQGAKEDVKKTISFMQEFLVELGFPKDLSESLSINSLKIVLSAINSVEKKN